MLRKALCKQMYTAARKQMTHTFFNSTSRGLNYFILL